MKVNAAGKHQERVFKLTVDSLMNVSGAEIRHEMCFAGIEDVKHDATASGTVWIKYKSEPQWRKVIMEPAAAQSLVSSLLESIKQYSAESEDNLAQFGGLAQSDTPLQSPH